MAMSYSMRECLDEITAILGDYDEDYDKEAIMSELYTYDLDSDAFVRNLALSDPDVDEQELEDEFWECAAKHDLGAQGR